MIRYRSAGKSKAGENRRQASLPDLAVFRRVDGSSRSPCQHHNETERGMCKTARNERVWHRNIVTRFDIAVFHSA